MLAPVSFAGEGESESSYLQIYDELFEHSWNEEVDLLLEAERLQATQYTGQTTMGESFGVRLQEVEALDIRDPEFLLSLTPEEYRNVSEMQAMHFVRGHIWTPLAQIEFAGTVAERRTQSGTQFELLPTAFFSEMAALYSSNTADIPCNETTFVIMVFGPGPISGNCYPCWIEYMNAMDAARDAFNSAAVAASQAAQDAQDAYDTGITAAVNLARARLRRWFRHSGAAAGGAVTSMGFDATMTAFNNTRAALHNALAASQAAYDTAMSDAQDAYDDAVGDALQALIDCLALCGDSPPVLLGYYFITYGCGNFSVTYVAA